jgi:hypothetical protein
MTGVRAGGGGGAGGGGRGGAGAGTYVKVVAGVSGLVRPPAVTRTAIVPCPGGLVAMQVVGAGQTTAVAGLPPKVTVVWPGTKPLPVRVTSVPPVAGPLRGPRLVTAGGAGGAGGRGGVWDEAGGAGTDSAGLGNTAGRVGGDRPAPGVGVGVGVGVDVGGRAGSTALAEAEPRPSTVTVCMIVVPGEPATASVNVITAPAAQPPVLMLTSNRVYVELGPTGRYVDGSGVVAQPGDETTTGESVLLGLEYVAPLMSTDSTVLTFTGAFSVTCSVQP